MKMPEMELYGLHVSTYLLTYFINLVATAPFRCFVDLCDCSGHGSRDFPAGADSLLVVVQDRASFALLSLLLLLPRSRLHLALVKSLWSSTTDTSEDRHLFVQFFRSRLLSTAGDLPSAGETFSLALGLGLSFSASLLARSLPVPSLSIPRFATVERRPATGACPVAQRQHHRRPLLIQPRQE